MLIVSTIHLVRICTSDIYILHTYTVCFHFSLEGCMIGGSKRLVGLGWVGLGKEDGSFAHIPSHALFIYLA